MKKEIIELLVFICLVTIGFGQEVKVDNGYEKGLLVDGFKEGVWEYYDDDSLKLKVDYSTGKLLYLSDDTSSYAIYTDTAWMMSKLDIPPRYIGSMEEIFSILYKNIRYPVRAISKSVVGTVLLGFEIDLNGKAKNVKLLRDIGRGCGDAVLKAFNLVPNYWLVAQKNGTAYKSRYILPVKFQIGRRTSEGKEWISEPKSELKEINASISDFIPANYLDKIVVSAMN